MCLKRVRKRRILNKKSLRTKKRSRCLKGSNEKENKRAQIFVQKTELK